MEKPRKGVSKGRIPTYEDSFKIAVAREYLAGNYSTRQIGEKYNLTKDNIGHFVRWYRKHYPDSSTPPVEEQSITAPSNDDVLTKELALAKLKITAMEMMISNYEQETGVNIAKKSGTKPPAK